MRLLLVLALIAVRVEAQSLLGMCHKNWSCKKTEAMYQNEPIIFTGWLENTFGESCKCADRLLADPRYKIIRVHLTNSACMRNKRCGAYEVLYGETAVSASRKIVRKDKKLLRKFNKVLARFKKRIDKAKNVDCYVSACLECDLTARARIVLHNLITAQLPKQCTIVDNPYRQPCMNGLICEKHGVDPKIKAPCIVDLDGIDGRTINVKKWAGNYKHCGLRYYWEPWMNCIEGKFVDPRERQCDINKSSFERTKRLLWRLY